MARGGELSEFNPIDGSGRNAVYEDATRFYDWLVMVQELCVARRHDPLSAVGIQLLEGWQSG